MQRISIEFSHQDYLSWGDSKGSKNEPHYTSNQTRHIDQGTHPISNGVNVHKCKFSHGKNWIAVFLSLELTSSTYPRLRITQTPWSTDVPNSDFRAMTKCYLTMETIQVLISADRNGTNADM